MCHENKAEAWDDVSLNSSVIGLSVLVSDVSAPFDIHLKCRVTLLLIPVAFGSERIGTLKT
jgi:hypothetical protein